MNPREARLAPPSLRRALLLLASLALLGSVLLGLLAQSAAAHDTALTAPSLTGPVTPGNDTGPSWSFSRPADTSTTTETVDASGATTTVTIAHDYSTECVYDAPVAADQRTQPCGVLFDATTDTFTGGVPDGDGTYALTVRTFESTTRTTQKTESDGTKGPAVKEALAETYSPASSAAYVYDGTAPGVTFAEPQPTGPSSNRNPSWSYTVSGGGAPTCTLTGPTTATTVSVACTTTGYTAALTASGTYRLAVTSKDAAGNSTTVVSSAYVLDVTAPAIALDPAGETRGTADTHSWSLTVTDGTATRCTLDGAEVTCTATIPVTRTTDGTSVLEVLATDDYGNQATASASYTRDTTVQFTVRPQSSPSSDRTPTWTYGSTESVRILSCELLADGVKVPGTITCSGTSYTSSELPTTAGTSYVLRLTVEDALLNRQTFDSAPYLLDTQAEALALQPAPGQTAVDNTSTPSWTYSGSGWTDPRCTFTLAGSTTHLGGTCTATGFTAPALGTSDGTDYVLTVTLTDPAGNTATATATYRLDTTPPTASLSPAASTGKDTTPEWAIGGTGFVDATCVLTGGGITQRGPCTSLSHHVAQALEQTSGTDYLLTVTVTDAAGNTATATASYRLDTTPPTVTAAAPGTTGNDRLPVFTFATETDAQSVVCTLVGTASGTRAGTCRYDTATGRGSFTPSSPLPHTTGETYTFTVTVTDRAGNAAGAQATYRLDSIAEVGAGTAPASPGKDPTPTWTFTSEIGAASVSCRLSTSVGVVSDGPCTTAGSFTSAADLPPTAGMTYTLVVTVVDAVGNTSSTTLATYRLDTIAELTATSPASPGNDTTPSWTFVTETGATVACALSGPGAPATGSDCSTVGFTAGMLPATAGADYVLTVTVTDQLGNETVYTLPTYRLDTVLPGATTTVPSSPSRATTVTWTVASSESLTSATCELRRDGVVVMSLASCPGSTTVSLPGDGRYDLVVTLVDLAGNRSTTTSSVHVHDATVPTAPVVTPTSVTSNRTTAVWTVTGEGGTSVTTCRVSRDGRVVQDWTPCAGTFSVALPADGQYLLEAVSTDPVGPGPISTVTYLLDTVLPVAPTVTGATGPAQGRSPSWTVTTETGTTTECRLVRGGTVVDDWLPCNGSIGVDLAGLPDGAYVLESRATDAAQNLGAVGASAPYVLDTTAPVAPVVTGPAGPSQVRAPGFTWTGEPGASAQCQLSRDGAVVGGWLACSPGYAPLLDRDGTWTLAVRLTDAAGNVSEPGETSGYVLDTTPPAAPVVTPPRTPGRDLAPSWGAVVEGGTSLECRLTGADGVSTAWAPCSLPLSTALTGRPDGAYVLEVRATDPAGNLSPVGSGTYVLDTVAPAAAVVISPSGPGRTRTPSFTYTTEPGAATRCRLTSGTTLLSDFAPCTSPSALDLTGLPDGTYTLTVRVTDAAGNPGPAATGTYVLDTTGPAAPVLTLSPASPSPARSVTWAFSVEPGSTLICRLLFPTGAVREIAGCTSPLTVDLTGLPDGSYTLTVRALDAAGNVGSALSDVHVVDSTSLAGPQVTGPVTPGSTRTPRWTISAGSTECRLTRGTTVLRDWAACSGSFTADLFGQPDGTYVLAVRSRDAAGAVSAAVLSRYLLDTTAPGAAVLVAPPTPSTNRLPTWTVASGDAGATAECRVLVFGSVLQDWAPCAVSLAGAPFRLDLTGEGDGSYTLVVRLTDAAGNRSSVLASSSFVLDTSAPVAVGVTGPGTVGNDVTPTWLLSSGSGAVLECRLTSAAGIVSDWAPCAGEYTADLTGLPDGIYTLAVRAVSAAGTPGPDTTSAYALSTAAPGAPTALALAGGLKPTSNNRAPSWTFTLPPGTTGLCRVVHGSRVLHDGPCSSPFRLDLSGAPDGSYTLTVRAVSAAGTPGPAATSTYVLDTVPTSEPVFTQVPGATGSTLDPQWRFGLTRGATAQCRLLQDGTPLEDWMPCTSPFTAQLTGRPDGTYVLQVRAVDSAGNTSAPVSNAYLLDRTAAPVAAFADTPPATGFDRTVTWTFTAPAGMTLECRVVLPDGSASAWGGCASTTAALRTTSAYAVLAAGRYALDLAGRRDGLYTLEVRTVDADGRRGAAAAAGYRLDTRPPAMPGFSDVPAATGSDPRPVWLWDVGTDELVECRLVRVGGGPVTDWQECADSQYVADLSRLAQGTYALELRVTDAAGNVSPVPSATYRYDTTAPPTPVVTSRPPAGGADRTVSWTFLVPPDARATCTVTRDRSLVREGPCAGRYDLDLSGLPDGTYTLTVRFTDAAGNTGASTSGAYALRTLGLGGPIRVDAPVPPAPAVPVAPVVAGPGRGGTGVGTARPQGSVSGPRVPIQVGEDDVVRASTARPSTPGTGTQQQEAAPVQPEPRPSQGNPLLPRSLPVEDVPEVLRDVVTGTITRPTLPLALLAIVALFLLAQNRIDRRDPKLASAPVEAEPELDFTVYVRRLGRALT